MTVMITTNGNMSTKTEAITGAMIMMAAMEKGRGEGEGISYSYSYSDSVSTSYSDSCSDHASDSVKAIYMFAPEFELPEERGAD
jgi:hypothetical protein